MKKVIAYALFGYHPERAFEFERFLRSLTQVIRMNKLVYPDWETRVYIDSTSYDSKFNEFFSDLARRNYCEIAVFSPQPLCVSMLQRIRPFWEFDRTYAALSRDLDSIATYREAQAVGYWVRNYHKTMHAITDSISHTEPLMGGMIGAIPRYFHEKFGEGFEHLILQHRENWNEKGTDQIFLRKVVYPRVTHDRNGYSITQHYLKGYGQTHYGDCFQTILDIELDIDPILKESNDLQVHIGQAGFDHDLAHLFFEKMTKHISGFDDFHKRLLAIEMKHKNIFYWA